MATTFAPEWDALREILLADGFDLTERRDHNLNEGGPARRLLGVRLGMIRLQSRSGGGANRNHAKRVAVLDLPTIDRILRETVDEFVERRVPDDAWRDNPAFDVATLIARLPHTAADSPRPRARAEQPQEGDGRQSPGVDVSMLTKEMAAPHLPPSATIEVKTTGGVWHLRVTLQSPAERDATFIRLAEGAMQLSAQHAVPIVVHVDASGAR